MFVKLGVVCLGMCHYVPSWVVFLVCVRACKTSSCVNDVLSGPVPVLELVYLHITDNVDLKRSLDNV